MSPHYTKLLSPFALLNRVLFSRRGGSSQGRARRAWLLRTLDGSLVVAIIGCQGEGPAANLSPKGTLLLPPVGDIFIALQHGLLELTEQPSSWHSASWGLTGLFCCCQNSAAVR